MLAHVYENPECYSKNNHLQYAFAMNVLHHAEIFETDRVLDLGCGDGRITAELAKIASKGCVIGSDASEKMIKHANRMYGAERNLRFMHMDMSKNVFNNQFDVITSFNSLHWVKDQINALKGIAQASVLNSRIFLLLSHKKSMYHAVLDNVCSSAEWASYFKAYDNPRSFFTKDEYEQLLVDAGLTVRAIEEKEMVYEFHSFKEFKLFLSTSMVDLKRIPKHLKTQFLDDYCSAFISSLRKQGKTISVGLWCLEVRCTRKMIAM